MPSVIVHGGAGTIDEGALAAHRDGCRAAAEAAWSILSHGGDALDAVVAAVVWLEDDPTFDAGRGGFLNRDGVVALDASVMRGSDLAAGAVAEVSDIANPVKLARTVLDLPEVLLVGEGASRLASEQGFELCSQDRLVTARELARWRTLSGLDAQASGGGTVGAVARDRRGGIAAATSTGGKVFKRPGRVGDSPLIGAGTYADDRAGGASATGDGEAIIRVSLTRMAVWHMGHGLAAPVAATLALEDLMRIGAQGGMIAIDGKGKVGWAFNTPHLARAYRDESSARVVATC